MGCVSSTLTYRTRDSPKGCLFFFLISENTQSSILLLGRYGFDAFNLGKSADFQYNPEDGSVRSHRFPGVKIEFMTVHRAKGLGYDNVIIIKTYTEEVDRKQFAGKGGRYFLIGKTVEAAMEKILSENPKSSILLLGRYGFDAFNLGKSADF